jgi:hypothetical protein
MYRKCESIENDYHHTAISERKCHDVTSKVAVLVEQPSNKAMPLTSSALSQCAFQMLVEASAQRVAVVRRHSPKHGNYGSLRIPCRRWSRHACRFCRDLAGSTDWSLQRQSTFRRTCDSPLPFSLALEASQAPMGPLSSEAFERSVLPMLAEKCLACHGAAQQLGGARLHGSGLSNPRCL